MPGTLAYISGSPVGWCSVVPRYRFSGMGRSRIPRPIDHAPFWSIVCFFAVKSFRNKGLSVRPSGAAILYASEHDAKIVEGYPAEPIRDRLPPSALYGARRPGPSCGSIAKTNEPETPESTSEWPPVSGESGREDLNLRPHGPEPCALAGLRYAPNALHYRPFGLRCQISALAGRTEENGGD